MEKEIASLLIDMGCLQLSPDNPFTYASGLKGPIYCDNRLSLSYPNNRKKIIQTFVEIIQENHIEFDLLAGLATAGIPHAAMIAHELSAPMIYIRSKPKGHGKGNMIEGKFEKGNKALLVEDLVNQGSSLEKAIIGAREAGLVVNTCLSIVDYQMVAAHEVLQRHDVKLVSLTNFEAILSASKLDDAQKKILESWHHDPKNWSN